MTYDIGHRLKVSDTFTLEQTAFIINWDEAIAFDSDSNTYINVSPQSEAYVYGLENTITFKPTKAVDVKVNFTVQNSDDGSDNSTEMTRVPRFTGGILSTYRHHICNNPAWFTVGVEHIGSRFVNASNSREAEARTVLNAAIGYQPSDKVTLSLRGENLTNDLESPNPGTSSNYTSVPISVFFGVEASF